MEEIRNKLNEIRTLAKGYPAGKSRKINNYCDKISIATKGATAPVTHLSAERLNARKAIFDALRDGARLSQMDCSKFEIEDMRTPISHMRSRFSDEGYDLNSRWILTPKGRKVKEYWLTPKGDA